MLSRNPLSGLSQSGVLSRTEAQSGVDIGVIGSIGEGKSGSLCSPGSFPISLRDLLIKGRSYAITE